MSHFSPAVPRAAGAQWSPAIPVLVCSMLLAALFAATCSAHGSPFGVDDAVHGWVLEHRPRWAVAAAVAVTVTGSGVPAYLLAAFAGTLAFRTDRRCGALVGALALLSVQLPRIAVASWLARPRPPADDWAWTASGYAMPSGHTTTSAAVSVLLTAGVYRTVRGRARTPLLIAPALWAATVGLSRVYLGMHWPTDVLAGWLLASVWAGLLGMFLLLLRRRKSGAVPSNESEGT
ncbi:phosphatase PAP2 family protein [Streptomyces sp. NRRL S-237]|uniref:phosphatase PAP2 family protein n=1 Tax=Streptomyces sp. NRRL S-237 TaxID=1463895 RepID=UPI00068BDCAD|nr:phosphatase PAP2 family protein [Streptomyces sp. NRRL S-237]